MIKRLLTVFIFAYIFCASWTKGFSIHPWLPVHVALGTSIAILFFAQVLVHRKKIRISTSLYHFEDIFLILGIIFITFSAALNAGSKSINYILAYMYVFIIGYLLFKTIFFLHKKGKQLESKQLLTANSLGILFVSLLAISEALLYLFFDINIQNYIPHSFRGVGQATYLGIFHRSYGLATEPTILAFYLNTLGPIGLWHWWQTSVRKIWKVIVSILFFLALISTFSPTVFTFLPLAFFVSSAAVFFDSIAKRKNLGFSPRIFVLSAIILVLIVCLLLYSPFMNKVKYFLRGIYEKVTLSAERVRVARWKAGLQNIQKAPIIGKGVGTTLEGSNINWYIYLTAEGGILSLLPFLIFFGLTFFRILIKSKSKVKRYFLTGFLAGIMHLMVISTFFHPFIWLLLILFNVYGIKVDA